MTLGALVGEAGDDVVGEDAVARAWGLLLDSSDAIADSITLTLLERDSDAYERYGPELRADVRASARQHIKRGLMIMSGGATGPLNATDLWRETGRRRARQGVPLEMVLHAYTVGARMLWEALVAKAGAGADHLVDERVLLTAASRVWSNLDTQNAVLIDAYRRESARVHRQDLQRQQATLDALLEGRGGDPAYVEEARAALDIGAGDDLACVVVLHEPDSANDLGSVEDRLDRAGIGARWHVRSGVYFGLLFGDLPDERDLCALLDPHAPARMGVARAVGGLPGFATAFLLANRAAETLARDERRVVSVADRLPEVLMIGSPQVTSVLIEQTIGPLLSQPEAQRDTLIETLEALLRHDGSPTHAAVDLFCHRNTVIYRLKQIETLTGRTLADPRDKMLLSLALAAETRPQG
ncbi:helix-turn-helix domain-containing protein [Nocardioides sp.]|uniref:PucR family transcriptional regulator n=1 Tax=Nocardioides sp. TaxID=35761 RepID=UPI002B26B88A|nr:helix-turn-helix domain-containing protein [Nocardioides sp.]